MGFAPFIAIFASAAATMAPTPGVLKTFGDWTAGCDNGRTCQASALLPEDSFEGVTMAIERDAAASSLPQFRLSMVDAPPIAVNIDGKPFRAAFVMTDNAVLVTPADTIGFVDAVQNGTRLELFAMGGVALGGVSLTGARAALLYIDEAQNRIGTVTALSRKGSKPASTVPAPPSLPVITVPPRSAAKPRPASIAVQKARIAKLDCEAGQRDDYTAEHFRLDAANSLTLLSHPCGNGAYNYYSEALIVSETGAVTAAKLDVSAAIGGNAASIDNIVVNAGYDPEMRELMSYAKGRGLGDCGTVNTYVWDGRRFRLSEQAVMDECRGSVDYITVWRTRVVGN